MMLSGVNVFRINFSHADYQDVEDRIKFIREINEEEDLAVGILADLQGPKLRIGNVAEGSELKPGDILKFTNDKVDGNKEVVYMTYTQFAP
ncbi:MAG: pyruvate kinase [Candidatus Ornithobacterium hominis]|nr:pyruvate kinase [Candidatus Ornithobacterium hominis]